MDETGWREKFMEKVESVREVDVPCILGSSPSHLSGGDQEFIANLAKLIAVGFCEKHQLPEAAAGELSAMVGHAISTCVEVKVAAAVRGYERSESLGARRGAPAKDDEKEAETDEHQE